MVALVTVLLIESALKQQTTQVTQLPMQSLEILIIDEVAPSGGAVALANEVADTWLNIADKLLN